MCSGSYGKAWRAPVAIMLSDRAQNPVRLCYQIDRAQLKNVGDASTLCRLSCEATCGVARSVPGISTKLGLVMPPFATHADRY